MLNKEIDWDEFKPLTKIMFAHARPYLDKINNIHAIERTLYSEYLGLLLVELTALVSTKENWQSLTLKHLKRSNQRSG